MQTVTSESTSESGVARSVEPGRAAGSLRDDDQAGGREEVRQPAKVIRIGTMITQLLDEVRRGPLDEYSCSRLRQIHDKSIRELASTLSPALAEELNQMDLPESDPIPSAATLRVAQAQLAGWLEGLFQGIQASFLAQQAEAEDRLGKQSANTGARPSSPFGTYL
jgi:hypothetical protein